MADMINDAWVQEVKQRLADRYTATELVDILELPVENIIDEYWDYIMKSQLLMIEVGVIDDNDIP